MHDPVYCSDVGGCTGRRRKRTGVRWIAERPYCERCYLRLGARGRAALVRARNDDLLAHRCAPDPEDPPATLEDEKADLRRQYSTIIKYGCPHRNLFESNYKTRKSGQCLCYQLYRWNGVALADTTWTARTRRMRVGCESIPASSPSFCYQEAACLQTLGGAGPMYGA